MILHYSLAIWKINDNALSLIFFVNAQRSGYKCNGRYLMESSKTLIFSNIVNNLNEDFGEDLKYI